MGTDVAIVGMAVLLPGAPDLDTYWQNLVDGVDAITEVPAHRWDPSFYDPAGAGERADRVYCRRGGFVEAEVSASRFGIMPTSVAGTEPDQLIALQVAASAIADAGGADRLPAADRVGVVMGRGGYLTPGLVRLDQRVRTANQLVRTLTELLPDLSASQLDGVRAAFTEQLGPAAPESAIGLVPNLAASRIANRLDLRGPAYTVDAACASSLIAVDHGVAELASGRCDAVLAGGVHHCHDITLWSVFAQLRALSRQERIRPFDERADGILIGEGTGVVVLKRLADAVAAGDRIYAVVRGTGVASDGRTASLFNPEPAGQARAVRRAWEAAGLDPSAPDALGLLEAHGTGTPTGDAAELATLAEVFGSGDRGSPAVIGSVKSMIGHTMPAAGVAGLVKAALAIHRAVLLPTLHCERPRPELDRTRFRPIAAAQPWEETGTPRRAGVNAFGFGGINAHVVLEEAPQARPGRRGTGVTVTEAEPVLRFAAATPAALAAVLDADDATVRRTGSLAPTGDPVRLGIVAPTPKRLAMARRIVAKGTPWRGRGDTWFSADPLLPAGRLAYVFPGLEAEFAPKVADVAARLGESTMDCDAANVGRQGAGVIAVGRLLERALRRMGITPDAVAGHSVGEWTAMISGGLYSGAAVDEFLASFDPDSVQVPGLLFAVVGAGADRVGEAIADRSGIALSHDNSPNQSIVCGPEAEVEELVGRLRRNRVLCQVLPFRSGFHTPMLKPYLGPIEAAADRFELQPPAVPVWSATTAAPFPADPAEVRALFVRHLVEPVRFRPLVEAMYDSGVRVFVQVGAGQLASVIGDTLHGRDHLAVAANVPHHSGLAQLRRVATALWADGGNPDTELLDGRRRTGPATPLDLGGALVSLGDRAAGLLPPAGGGAPTTLDSLRDLSVRTPVAGELAALLRETADTAVALLTTNRQPAPARVRGTVRTDLEVSVAAMPYLRDHCFFRQRDGWPDEADHWPVVPATTVVGHMMAAAEQAAPGQRAVAVVGARFNRWVAAAPARTVPVTVDGDGTDRVRVDFGGCAQATVELAAQYPPRPPAWRPDPATEQAPAIEAAQLYTERWMFHGPLYQGVSRLLAIGDGHVRGVITTPPAPGALLDNVGQLLGYWIMSKYTTRRVVFPVGMARIAVHGPHPAAGTPLECLLRISSVTDSQLVADAQLIVDGQVWCEITGWVDRRFDSHPDTHAVERFADRNTLSRRQPGGWTLVFERWPDLASRDLVVRTYLGSAERERYDQRPPRSRRQWFLGRVAAKDAVRQHLWKHGAGRVFPAEIGVDNDASGRPGVSGVHGRQLPYLDVSIAHRAEVGVALARPAGNGGVGIDVEEVTDRPDSTIGVALTETEAALLAGLVAETGEPTARWFTRMWAAKEAVGKALGTGLDGRPRRFVVTAANASDLMVEAADRRFRVAHTRVDNPPDLPAREYVVAWTTDEGDS